MEQALFEKIVDEIASYDVSLIQPFLNNDPLMDRNILPRLRLLIRKNPAARVMITTNGYLLRPELARELAVIGLETIHISSNGLTADVYRETMGLDGYTVLKNVNTLWDEIRRAGSSTRLVVTAVLMKANRRRSRTHAVVLAGARRELLPEPAEQSRRQSEKAGSSNCCRSAMRRTVSS